MGLILLQEILSKRLKAVFFRKDISIYHIYLLIPIRYLRYQLLNLSYMAYLDQIILTSFFNNVPSYSSFFL